MSLPLLAPIELTVDPALAATFRCEVEVVQPDFMMLITPGGETYLPDQPPTALVTVGEPNVAGKLLGRSSDVSDRLKEKSMASILTISPAILELQYVSSDSKPLAIDCQTKDSAGTLTPFDFTNAVATLRTYDIDQKVTSYLATITASTLIFDLSADPGTKSLTYDIQVVQGAIKRTILAGNLNFTNVKNPGAAGASFQEPSA